jgi:cellulose synthase/poly-beta-1,6-N-acetylglucosamine synthase-like glycosyltransferase
VAPIREGSATYTYGGQIGGEFSKFGEKQVFSKYYPSDPDLAQNGFFCNNANAALLRSAWQDYQFDEDLTGLEDMDLAKRLMADKHRILYVPESIVYHLHDESWGQIKTRYEREAVALHCIMPEVNFYFSDFLRYLTSSIVMDLRAALGQREVLTRIFEIFMFRLMQYWGTYRGNHVRRELSRVMKEHYFYPRTKGIPNT